MNNDLFLVLENGTVFKGRQCGFDLESDAIMGEAVFSTSMTGYLETLTDKSYYGQIIVQTFPLIGNYGVMPEDCEGERVYARGYIVRELCDTPSNFRSKAGLNEFLVDKKITGICGIDTRMLTKIIREEGVMNAVLTKDPKVVNFRELKDFRIKDAVRSVSSCDVKEYKTKDARYNVALLDFGYKEGIVRELVRRKCNVIVFPHDTTLNAVMEYAPDGIMLTNGPGDPKDNIQIIGTIKELLKTELPMFGICLGHQLLALASGLNTVKLKYGHRGANQAVKDLKSGRVYITSQNHGYCVEENADLKNVEVSFRNVNDQTIEGLDYSKYAFSVQFHPEGSGGAMDTAFLFDRFIRNIEQRARQKK